MRAGGIFLAVLLALAALAETPLAQKLNIWLVAHSHDDTGWLRTIDEYYIYEVQYILDSVVDSLALNPNRKFIEVEMAYFSRWWNEQTEERKALTRTLVERGQLEFINAGWCMNDEAVPTYYAIIDQMTLGHEFLRVNFGNSGKPTIGWSIDPFGHSNVAPTLYSLMGFDAFYMNRIDYRLKDTIKASKEMEFIWSGSSSLGETVSMWTHIMDEHYCTPGGFNWEHGVTQDLPSGDGPPPIVIDPPSWVTESNAFERAQEFVNEAKRRAQSFATPNILIPFGCDFTFQNANMMFKNMDRLIDTINKYSDELGATAQYSSLSDYAKAVKGTNSPWINRQEDFFPYADNGGSYWTGYFSSRPLVKSASRAAHGVLRNADFLFSLIKAQYGVSNAEAWKNLNLLRAPESVVQHHDGVTGTFRRLVGEDYLNLLHGGILTGNAVISEMLGQFVSDGTFNPEFSSDPAYLSAELAKGNTVPVVVFNSLPWARRHYVNITISTSDVAVTDSNGNAVRYQVNPQFTSSKFVLFFLADLPALGFATYNIAPAKNEANLGRLVALDEVTVLENEYLRLEFNNATGLTTGLFNKRTGVSTPLAQGYWEYQSVTIGQTSGAYIFRPTRAATRVASSVTATAVVGPHVQQVHQVFRNPSIRQDTFIFSGLSAQEGSHIEVHSHLGPLGSNQEITLRYESGLKNDEIFFSDNNGFEMQRRVNLPSGRPGDFDDGVRIAGNFYPAVSRAYIKDSSSTAQLTVATQSTHAVASLAGGQLEFLLHRHCSRDDARGMNEALDDTSAFSAVSRFTLDTADASTEFHQRSSKQLSFPVSISYGNPASAGLWKRTSHTFLSASLPENTFLLSLNARDSSANEITLRLFNSYEKGSHSSLAQPSTINLRTLFNGFQIIQAEERTLTLLEALPQQPADLSSIQVDPIQIRTFSVVLAAN